jgi:hypothetical protein
LSDNLGGPKKPDKGRYADKRLSSREFDDIVSDPNERRQLAIKNLLENLPVGVDDKLTTVKAAHHVDKDRFHSAFRSLMRSVKP